MLSAETLEPLLRLLPEPQVSSLAALMMQKDATEAQWATAIGGALESLDWEAEREQIGELINRMIPLETLLPEIYGAWRPVVRDAVAYIGTHLSVNRLVPKLVEQIMLPPDVPLEQRLTRLIAQMPSLQKIGQVVARNRHLDPDFRAELIQLENSLQDVEPTVIRAEVEQQLGRQLEMYRVAMQDVHLAEASVSAAVRFTWINPRTGQREPGVFKVQKPYVRANFSEELNLLQGLATFFEARRRQYGFAQVQLREMFDDIRRLLAQEIDFRQEQASLVAAARRYAGVRGVRIPRLIPELSTTTITAATEEEGVKITEAFPRAVFKRRQVAARLIEALFAVPLFDPEAEAIFHADPHAGNLFVDERTGDLIIFDWALTERLTREERRQIVLLMLAVALRDDRLIVRAIAALSQDDVIGDKTRRAVVREQVTAFIAQLSSYTVPGPKHVLSLLDMIVYAGIRFSTSLLVVRKVLFTLDGVLYDVTPGMRMMPVLAWYALTQGRWTAAWRCRLGVPVLNFRFPLSLGDVIVLYCSAVFFGSRLWLQVATQVRDSVLREFQAP